MIAQALFTLTPIAEQAVAADLGQLYNRVFICSVACVFTLCFVVSAGSSDFQGTKGTFPVACHQSPSTQPRKTPLTLLHLANTVERAVLLPEVLTSSPVACEVQGSTLNLPNNTSWRRGSVF